MLHLDAVNYKHNEAFVKAFGENLRRLRIARGFSMREFANMADMEYKQLSLIERGMINTTISTAFALADALEISHQELFDFKIAKQKK